MIWCMYMKRYQVYLNPKSVSILDEFEKYSSISRSKLIREAIDRLAQNLSKVFVDKEVVANKKMVLDSLIGIITDQNLKETNYAVNDDSIYLND